MVYALPVHHPLPLIEEICMLDRLNGGRLEIGHGRFIAVANTDQGGSCNSAPRLPDLAGFFTCSMPGVVDLLS